MRNQLAARLLEAAAHRQLAQVSRRDGIAIFLALALVFLACGKAPPPAGGPVVLVVIDTLRADHLGLYGHERDTSPELDAWAAQGRVYERAWSTSSWTLPSVASLLTGRLPSSHGAVALVPLPNDNPLFGKLSSVIPTLAQRFGSAGYATAAFVTNPYLKPLLGLDRGFDRYNHSVSSSGRRRRADAMVDRALEWIDRRGEKPFFVLLHLMDPHMSYDAPPPQRGRFTSQEVSKLRLPVRGLFKRRSGNLPKRPRDLSAEDWRFVRAAYDEEIAFVDAQLGRLRRALEERGILERGIVALTADHGEELFDHGGFEHGHTLYEELVRVPLVFFGAGVRAGREAEPVSLVDVAPTLLEAAGLAPAAEAEGLSLWPNLSDTAAIPERTLHFHDVLYGEDRRGALRWPWKAVVSEGVEGVEYWNLELDPHEQKPAAGRIPPPVARLLVEIGEQGRSAGAEAAALDERTLEELKALGYLD